MAFSELKNKLQNLAYGSRVYQNMLRGDVPSQLRVVPVDIWPAQATLGQHYLNYDFGLGIEGSASEPTLLELPKKQRTIDARVHDFAWLRDLRVLGGDDSRRRARAVINAWLDKYANWDEAAWALPLCGARVANALALHDFYAASASDDFRARLFDTLASHVRHLAMALPANLQGYHFLQASKGLIFGSLCLPGLQAHLDKATALLLGRLDSLLTPDGFVRERSPKIQLQALRDLIDVRNLLSHAGFAVPQQLTGVIDAMAPALRFCCHGDGTLALFHGSDEGLPVLIDAVLQQTGTRSRKRAVMLDSGYEKVTGGRSLLLIDAGLPPADGFDGEAHAGIAAFEFSSGREKIIVNCGALERPTSVWRQALAATAAHSTLTVADTNAAVVLQQGIGKRPSIFEVEREESDSATCVTITHNAYAEIAQVLCRRSLQLSEDGLSLQGEEHVRGQLGTNFSVRFHLHPHVQVSLIQDGRAALIKLASGHGWRLRCQPYQLTLMPSVYAGDGRTNRPTKQLVIEGRLNQDVIDIAWSLTKES